MMLPPMLKPTAMGTESGYIWATLSSISPYSSVLPTGRTSSVAKAYYQGLYISGHLKSKAIQDFSRLFEKEIQDCLNDICTFKQ